MKHEVFETTGTSNGVAYVIPAASPHPDMEIGVRVIQNGHVITLWFTRDEARRFGGAISAASGKRR